MPILRYTSSVGSAVIIDLNKDYYLIGRGRVCDVHIPDDVMVSRKHCEVVRLPSGQFALKDLSSKNGTLVNGVPVSTWVLRDGDVISVGGTLLTFKLQK